MNIVKKGKKQNKTKTKTTKPQQLQQTFSLTSYLILHSNQYSVYFGVLV